MFLLQNSKLTGWPLFYLATFLGQSDCFKQTDGEMSMDSHVPGGVYGPGQDEFFHQ